MRIKLKSLLLENFKGVRHLDIGFGNRTEIAGANATGKSTVVDAFSWLLFDKDSQGNANFAIRPKDADGRDIDNIEIMVEGVLSIDDDEVTLTKIQKQKWVKKRGSQTQTFEGNENSFLVDGFPAKKSEYEAKIKNIIDENLFKLLTNPRTFAALKWQDQRKILLEFVSEITDTDILETDADRYAPIASDVLAAGADKAREKAMVALRTLKKQQAEYPVRIDEALRNITSVPDADYVGEMKAKAERELEVIQKERDSLSEALKAVGNIQAAIMQTKLDMGGIEAEVAAQDHSELMAKRQEAAERLNALMRYETQKDKLLDRKAFVQKTITDGEADIAELAAKYKEVRSRALPHDETVCPTCGREFEAEKIEAIEKEFESRKARDLERISRTGKSARANVDAAKAEIAKLEEQIAELTVTVEEAEKQRKAADEAVKNLQPIDYRETSEYKALEKKMAMLQAKLATMDNGDDRKQALADREAKARAVLDEVNRSIAAIEANARAEARADELRAEQRRCGQLVADQEQAVYLLEEFVKAKMDLLSDRINEKFSKVRFRLFTQQINGAITETCTMQINSNGAYVDYKDANNAAQIIGGLDVIDALSSLYDASAPILIDNAEAISSGNMPEMRAQMVMLTVTDDKKLSVRAADLG